MRHGLGRFFGVSPSAIITLLFGLFDFSTPDQSALLVLLEDI